MSKKTGINKGIQKGVEAEKFYDKVICKKCHKEVEFLMGSELFLKCPRCAARVERDIKQEEKQVKKIISLDILRRSKRAQLALGFTLMAMAVGYAVIGFFTGLFDPHWWLGLIAIPFLILSFFLIRGTKKGSASAKYRFYAWLALWVNLAALIIVVALSVPTSVQWINEFLGR